MWSNFKRILGGALPRTVLCFVAQKLRRAASSRRSNAVSVPFLVKTLPETLISSAPAGVLAHRGPDACQIRYFVGSCSSMESFAASTN